MEPQEPLLNKILRVTLVILILISFGFIGFVFWSTNQNKIPAKTTLNISPTVTTKKNLVITPTVVESVNPNDVDVGSVEADLKDIGTDIESLK